MAREGRWSVDVLHSIVVLLSLAVFTIASAMVFLEERKRAFAFLLMAIGFGLSFVAQFVDAFTDDAFKVLRLFGMAIAAFAFLGYLWPRIRSRTRVLLARFGIAVPASAEASASAKAAADGPAPPPPPPAGPAPEEPAPRPQPAPPASAEASARKPLPPLDLPPEDPEETLPPTPPSPD
jgi:hypothetical protein